MPSPAELLADVKVHIAEVETNLERFAGDVEGHLRVCLAHLRAIVTEERREVVAPEEPKPEAETSEPATTAPPKRGPGSGSAAWRDHAAAVGVDVHPEASRDEVMEALTTAGVAPEEPKPEAEV